MAGRLLVADNSLVRMKKQLQTGQSSPPLRQTIDKLQEVLSASGPSYVC
jgi:hypothetical protein